MAHGNRRRTIAPMKANKGRRKWHKDWRTWLAVLLMLVAMAMYVLSLDDSIVPRFLGR